jgi:hypothetical protein
MDGVERTELGHLVRARTVEHGAREVDDVDPSHCLSHEVRDPGVVDAAPEQSPGDLQQGQLAGDQLGVVG